MVYTKAQLEQLIAGAKALGFQDDVNHWTAKLKELDDDYRYTPPAPYVPMCGARSTEGYTCVKRPANLVAQGDPNHHEQHMFYFWTDENPTVEKTL